MFKDALRCTDELIELEPHNNQFLNLKEKISAKLQKGMAQAMGVKCVIPLL